MSGISWEERQSRSPICSVEGCGQQRRRLTFCNRHYKLQYRNGTPTLQKRATSTPGKSALARKDYVYSYLLTHGCADCGYDTDARALSFDHRPGTVKIRDIKSGMQFGWQALLDEIAKCDVVCMNCHTIRTSERRKEVMPVSIPKKTLTRSARS